MEEKTKVLLIDDNPGDARLVKEMLSEGTGASILNGRRTCRQDWRLAARLLMI